MVLAEVAIAIPMLMVVAAILAWAVSLVGAAAVLSDAARQVARDLARGVPVEQAVGDTQATVPEAVIEVRGSDDTVVVVARREVSAPFLGGLVVPIEQSVAVPREWT